MPETYLNATEVSVCPHNNYALKIRPRRWGLAEVEQFVQLLALHKADPTPILGILKDHSILMRMCSNRRSCYFLIDYLIQTSKYWNTKTSVAGALEYASRKYILLRTSR